MPPHSQVTPEVEVGGNEHFDTFRDHYFTRQRRKREEGEEHPNGKRRAERAIRKRVKEQRKAREQQEKREKEGEQRAAEEPKQMVYEEEIAAKKKEQSGALCARSVELRDQDVRAEVDELLPESENGASLEDRGEGEGKRKTVTFPIRGETSSSDDESEDEPANSQSTVKNDKTETASGVIRMPRYATTPLDTSRSDLSRSQKCSPGKRREGTSEVTLSLKKRKRVETPKDAVQDAELEASPSKKRTKKLETASSTAGANDIDSNVSDSESEPLERMVRETRRYLMLALSTLERIDTEERRLRNEERKLLLEERRTMIALEALGRGDSKSLNDHLSPRKIWVSKSELVKL